MTMLKLKKYANGQFFDTINKKYITVAKLKEMVQKGEKIQVILTKTGKNITDSVLEQFAKKEDKQKRKKDTKKSKKSDKSGKSSFLNTENLKKWAGKIIDVQISNVLESIKLPNKKQIEELDANIKALNNKIDKLEALQKKTISKAKSEEKTAVPEVKTTISSDKTDAQ
jgi:polyhydroxyalkanoate synthesis regulator protein